MENSSLADLRNGSQSNRFQISTSLSVFSRFDAGICWFTFRLPICLEHGGPGTAGAINVFFNTNPIPGTGPYEFSHIAEQSYALFTQNPTYWDSDLIAQQIQANPFLDPGHVKNIIVYYKADDLARFTDVSSGKAQIAVITSSDWNSVISNPTKVLLFPSSKILRLGGTLLAKHQTYTPPTSQM